MGYFPVRYDSRVVIYEHKMFIRLATGPGLAAMAGRCRRRRNGIQRKLNLCEKIIIAQQKNLNCAFCCIQIIRP